MNIKSSDLVLEIGSGDNPNPRSDVLCDRFVHDNTERAGKFSIRIDRPFVVCDGYSLPFRDKQFDFVIASHIFEHMDDPSAFAEEIIRVGKSGYIEVPSAVSERIFGWDFHHWYCEASGKTFVMRSKKEGERHGGFFHALIQKSLTFREWFEDHEKDFYIKIHWRNTISLKVMRKNPTNLYLRTLDEKANAILKTFANYQSSTVKFYLSWMYRRIRKKVRKEFLLLFWNFRKHFHQAADVYEIIVCPECKSKVTKKQNRLFCSRCMINYSISKRIPIMLDPTEKKKGY